MSTLLSKVPLEIRRQIYEELLVDGVHFFIVDGLGVYKNEYNLHPAILSTCKQVYLEASAVLYEQNHLRYTNLVSSAQNGLPIANLNKIRYLEISQSSIAARIQQSTKLAGDWENLNNFATAIQSIASSDHTLKTLRLLFEFSEDENPFSHVELSNEDVFYTFLDFVAAYATNQDLQKAISDLRVEDKISIGARSFPLHGDFHEHMREFVNKIASLKGWAVTLEYQDEERNYWVLEPMTTAIENLKISSESSGSESS